MIGKQIRIKRVQNEDRLMGSSTKLASSRDIFSESDVDGARKSVTMTSSTPRNDSWKFSLVDAH